MKLIDNTTQRPQLEEERPREFIRKPIFSTPNPQSHLERAPNSLDFSTAANNQKNTTLP